MVRAVEKDAGRIEMQQLRRDTLTGLSGIREELVAQGINPSKVDKKTPPLTRAIDNLTFINEVIAPTISGFEERVQPRIEIVPSITIYLLLRQTLYAGSLKYTGNSLNYHQLIPGYSKLDSDMMKGMWVHGGEFKGLISRFSKMSKDAILKKFENEVRGHL